MQTVKEINKLVPQTETYALDPGTTHIVTYDYNCVSHAQMRALAEDLQHRGIFIYLIGYDGIMLNNPIRFFEVKK